MCSWAARAQDAGARGETECRWGRPSGRSNASTAIYIFNSIFPLQKNHYCDFNFSSNNSKYTGVTHPTPIDPPKKIKSYVKI